MRDSPSHFAALHSLGVYIRAQCLHSPWSIPDVSMLRALRNHPSPLRHNSAAIKGVISTVQAPGDQSAAPRLWFKLSRAEGSTIINQSEISDTRYRASFVGRAGDPSRSDRRAPHIALPCRAVPCRAVQRDASRRGKLLLTTFWVDTFSPESQALNRAVTACA